ncbi:kelch repeat-containing protein [soil metagenome]
MCGRRAPRTRAAVVAFLAALLAASCGYVPQETAQPSAVGSGPEQTAQPPAFASGPEQTAQPPAVASGPEQTAQPPAGVTGTPQSASPPPTSSLANGSWTAMTEAPTALTEVAAAEHAGAIWVAGGFDADGQAVLTVQIYDPDGDSWSTGPELPQPVHHAALVSTGDELLLIGGYVGNRLGQPTAAVRRLDADGASWVDGPSLPEARAAGAAAWDGTRVLYGGGVGPDGLSGAILALEGGDWRPVELLTQAREHLAAASDGAGRVWFLGGRTGGLDSNLATVDLVEGNTVRAVSEVPTARGGVAAFWSDAHGACLVGGEQPGGTLGEVECIAPDGETVTLPELAFPRHGLGAAVVDGVAHALLGGPEPGLTVGPVVEALILE